MVFVFLAAGLFAAENPESISPGNALKPTVIDQICPTFSWAQVPGAAFYKIAVFEMTEMYEGMSYYENQAALSSPVLIKEFPGTASSWTPSLEEALQNGGRYVWFVQSQDAYGSSTWSAGKKFAVRASLGLTEIREKVKEQLEAQGVKGDLVDEAFRGIQSQDVQSKEGGELTGKVLSGEKEEAQSKAETQANKEIKNKENQNAQGTGDFVAGTLGSENDGNHNVYYGSSAGSSLGSGAWFNSFFGYMAGYKTDDADNNTFLGYRTGQENTSGHSNTFVGHHAGYDNTTGDYNTIVGMQAGADITTQSYNTFLGHRAGYLATSSYSTFIGRYSGYNTTGDFNVFVGHEAGEANTSGQRNVFIGEDAGYGNTTGNYNVYIGENAGDNNQTGSFNIFLGRYAGYNETGSSKLYIDSSSTSSPLIYGDFMDEYVTINGELNVTESNINVDTASTRARFKLQADGGGTNTDDYFNFTMRNDYGDVTLSVWDHSASGWLPMLSYEYLNSKVDFKNNDIVTTGTISSGGGAYTSGGAWIEASSRDYKENIMELDQAESFKALASLNPVRYNYKNKKDEEFLGFIAEEVPDLVAMNGRKGMRAMDIVAVLTKVVQDQQKTINGQEVTLEEQKKINKELQNRIKKLEEKSHKKQ